LLQLLLLCSILSIQHSIFFFMAWPLFLKIYYPVVSDLYAHTFLLGAPVLFTQNLVGESAHRERVWATWLSRRRVDLSEVSLVKLCN
jgi:hypothetical protein